MPDLRHTRLIDYLATSTKRDYVRRGPTEATLSALNPVRVLLDGVATAVPCTLVGTAPTAAQVGKRCLVIEAGGAKRYFMGVLDG